MNENTVGFLSFTVSFLLLVAGGFYTISGDTTMGAACVFNAFILFVAAWRVAFTPEVFGS